jgi:hypothetical protein
VIFRTLEDGRYVATDAELGIEFHCEHVRHDRFGELIGTLTVACGMLGTRAHDGPLLSATYNFSNLRSRDEWSRRLAQRARTNGKLDWHGRLNELSALIIAAEREGHTPAVILRNVPVRPSVPMFDVLGLRFPKHHASSMFGAGDGLKSYLSLYGANEQARAGVRVGYFDWELDAEEHRPRQARIDPELPDILYIKCDRPLVHDIDRLRRIRRNERLEYGWFDSAAYGTDGKPEDAVSAMAYLRALRQLEMGACVIAHSRREDGDMQPFGSIFWHNSFRATWNLKRASTLPDGETITLGAFPRKFNLSAHPPAVGITVQFDGDRVYFTRTDVAQIDELAESVPLWQRIRTVVKAGPQTLATIASELNHGNVESLDRIVRKHKNLFTKVSGNDGITRIALVERRAS